MKIAALLPRVPWPLEKGDKLRAYHLLRQLSAQHEIYLFALAERKDEKAHAAMLEKFCKRVKIYQLSRYARAGGLFRALQMGWPLQAGYYYNTKAISHWQQFVKEVQPDHLFYQLIRTIPYANAVGDIPSTIDYQDTFSLSMRRQAENTAVPMKWIWQREANTVAKFEQMAFDQTDHQLIISDRDRQHLPVSDPNTVDVITNGIDLVRFQPHITEKVIDLIFAGNMGYRPNILAARYLVKEIMPEVWAKRPQTTLALVGTNPAPAVRQLAEERVQVTGYVDHITNWYAQSRILVAPMQTGAGLQNKILEAMAMELPCVITGIAQKGLPKAAHALTLTENTASDLADVILTLLDDENYGQLLGKQGRKYVENAHSWEHIGEELEEMIADKKSKL